MFCAPGSDSEIRSADKFPCRLQIILNKAFEQIITLRYHSTERGGHQNLSFKMFFRMPRFVRRYLRRRMHPMAEKDAWSWKTRLSVMYALLAWNSLGFVLYQIYKGNKHWPTSLGLTTKEEDEMRPGKRTTRYIRIPNFLLLFLDPPMCVEKHEFVEIYKNNYRYNLITS